MDYFFEYDARFEKFLGMKGISNVTSDSDIMCVTLEAHNDTTMMTTIKDFVRWCMDEDDMSINPNGVGSRYHQG